VVIIHQRHGQTDRQTDGEMPCDSKTALCTVVHRSVKTKLGTHILYIWHCSACIDPDVKRSNVKVTRLQKRHGCMAAAACGRCATAAGAGLHVVWLLKFLVFARIGNGMDLYKSHVIYIVLNFIVSASLSKSWMFNGWKAQEWVFM